MTLLEKLNKQKQRAEEFKKDIPFNALATMMPSDGVPFMAKSDWMPVLVIENMDADTGFKETFLVDADVAQSLPKNKVSSKMMHVLQTQKDEIRFAILSHKPTNTWNRSKLELIQASNDGKVVSVKRDKEASVYGFSIEHDIAPFEIDMVLVEESLEQAFGGDYFIDSLEHDMAKQLLEGEGEYVETPDGVDDKKELDEETVEVETSHNDEIEKPKPISLSESDEWDVDDIKLDDEDDYSFDFNDIPEQQAK